MASTTVDRCLPIHHDYNKNKSVCGSVKDYLASPFDYSGRSYKILSIKNNQMEVCRDDHALTRSEIAFRIFLTCIGFFIIAAGYKICRLIQLSKYTISLKQEPPILENDGKSSDLKETIKKIEQQKIEKIDDLSKKTEADANIKVDKESVKSPVKPHGEQEKVEGGPFPPFSEVLANHHIRTSKPNAIFLNADVVMRLSNATILDISKFELPIDLEKFQELLKTWKEIKSIVLPPLDSLNDAFLQCLAMHASQHTDLIFMSLLPFQQRLVEATMGKTDYKERPVYKKFVKFLIDNNALKQEMTAGRRKELQILIYGAYENRSLPEETQYRQILHLFMLQENDRPSCILEVLRDITHSKDGCCKDCMQNITDKQLQSISDTAADDKKKQEDVIRIFSRILHDIIAQKEKQGTTTQQIFAYIEKIEKSLVFFKFENIFEEHGFLRDAFTSSLYNCEADLRTYLSVYHALQLLESEESEEAKISAIKKLVNYLSCISDKNSCLIEQKIFGKILAQNCLTIDIRVCFSALVGKQTAAVSFLSEILKSNDPGKIMPAFKIFLKDYKQYDRFAPGAFANILPCIDSKEKLAAIRNVMPMEEEMRKEVEKILVEGVYYNNFGTNEHYKPALSVQDVKDVLGIVDPVPEDLDIDDFE